MATEWPSHQRVSNTPTASANEDPTEPPPAPDHWRRTGSTQFNRPTWGPLRPLVLRGGVATVDIMVVYALEG